MNLKRLALAAVLVTGALTACTKDNEKPASSGDPTTTTSEAPTEDTEPPPATSSLRLTGTEFAYAFAEGSATVPTGDVSVTLDNAGEQDHQISILRLKDGKTLDDFASLADDPSRLAEVVDGYGGPNNVAPGESFTTSQHLIAGSYVFVCLIPDPADDVPHAAKGMLTPVTVEGEQAPPTEELVDNRIVMKDYDFGFGDDALLPTGEYEFLNDGPQPHEAVLFAPAEGSTTNDVVEFFAGGGADGPPPYVSSGGVGPISPGVTTVADIEVAPGDYVLVCFIPDSADGAPHFTKGMIQVVSFE